MIFCLAFLSLWATWWSNSWLDSRLSPCVGLDLWNMRCSWGRHTVCLSAQVYQWVPKLHCIRGEGLRDGPAWEKWYISVTWCQHRFARRGTWAWLWTSQHSYPQIKAYLHVESLLHKAHSAFNRTRYLPELRQVFCWKSAGMFNFKIFSREKFS